MKSRNFKRAEKGRVSDGFEVAILDFDDIRNPLLNAGQARATYEVGVRLAKKGRKVVVLSSKYPGSKDRVEDGINYKHIGLGSSKIRLNNIFYILSLPFALRSLSPDIVLECFTGPISTLCSPLWTKSPVVALPTSFEADRHSKLYHLPFERVERFGLRFYKYFLPYSEYFDKKMKNVNPKVISKLVPQGVSKDFFKIPRKTPKHILYLGRYEMDQKGLDLLIESYAKVSSKIDFPLIIAGKGPDESKINDLISNYGLENKVKVIGPAYGDKKTKLLSEALFVAFPSRHEGFSLFSLEALASGCAMVGFDIPGLAWSEKESVLKAEPFNVDDYAKLLKKASNINLAKKMGRNARNFAKRYSWEKVAGEFDSFFKEVLKREGKISES